MALKDVEQEGLVKKAVEHSVKEYKPKEWWQYPGIVHRWWGKDCDTSTYYVSLAFTFVCTVLTLPLILSWLTGTIFVILSLSWLGQAIGFAIKDRVAYKRKLKKNAMNEREIPEIVERYLSAVICEHRERAVGEGTAICRLANWLSSALDEARNLKGYWSSKTTPKAQKNLEAIAGIEERIANAQKSLSRQQQALMEFFDGCSGQTSSIKEQMQDAVAEWRLNSLSVKVDVLSEEVDMVAFDTISSFFEKVDELMALLENIEKENLLEAAAACPLEQMDAIAQKIVDVEEENFQKINLLKSRLATGLAT